jgi:hypothetical protein
MTRVSSLLSGLRVHIQTIHEEGIAIRWLQVLSNMTTCRIYTGTA